MRSIVSIAAFAATTAFASTAAAHWCDCLWVSDYNLVVRPVQDSVDVPAAGSATLTIHVQNNMGYPLWNFELEAYASGVDISIAPAQPKAPNFLLPGESQLHVLEITSSSGATNLAADNIKYYIRFGNSVQDRHYGDNGSGGNSNNPPGTGAVVSRTTGDIVPASPSISGDNTNSQARHIVSSARVDFADAVQGLNDLFNEYCAGTGSWADEEPYLPITNCSVPDRNCCAESGGAPAAFGSGDCSVTGTGGGNKFTWQHLWAAGEIAYRKSHQHVIDHLSIFRDRLMCGRKDNHPAFEGFATFILGYLGPDAGVQSDLTDLAGTGATTSDSTELMARAAVFMLTNGGSYRTDMENQQTGCLSAGISNNYVRMNCAAALRFVDGPSVDNIVQTELIDRVYWGGSPPEDSTLTAEGFYAAHLLNLLAWEEKGWARLAQDNGAVSFYAVEVDDTPPAAPAGLTCTQLGTNTDPVLRVSWNPVTQDTDGGSETMGTYMLYLGDAAREGGCTAPADAACHFNLAESTDTSSIYVDFDTSDLNPGQHYFTVRATDASENTGSWSSPADFSCPMLEAPDAVLNCVTDPADATLTGTVTEVVVTCDCADSTDDGNIAACYFSLNGAEDADPISPDATRQWTFDAAGSHTVGLRVVDDTPGTPLEDTTQTTIAIDTEGNQAPIAVVSPSSATCSPGDVLPFDGTGSYDRDQDGSIVGYSWFFSDDGTMPSGDTTTHECGAAGSTFRAILFVTDDGDPPATGVGVATVTVVENAPPILIGIEPGPTPVRTNTQITADARPATDPDGIASYLWNFDDGTSSTDALAYHAYTSEGVYNVTLTVTDGGSPPATATASWPVTVSNAVNGAPSCATATVSPANGGLPLTVALDASGCSDPEGQSLTVSWSVGGTTYNTLTAEHTFTEAGTYEISLTATDSGSPPMQSPPRSFTVVAGVGSTLLASCTSAAPGAGASALALAVPLLWRWRRRRRRR